MNCQQARNLFDAYLDGELSPTLDAELAAHRLQCTDCRHELALLQVAGHVIAAGDGRSHPLDERFTDRLLACIETTPQPATIHLPHRWRMGAIGLAAAAVLAIGFTLWLNRPGPRVAGVIRTNPDRSVERVSPPPPDADLEDAADSLVRQVDSTWNMRARSAQSLLEFGQVTIMQILDQFGVDGASQPAEAFEPLPESLDELAPQVDADDIEDL